MFKPLTSLLLSGFIVLVPFAAGAQDHDDAHQRPPLSPEVIAFLDSHVGAYRAEDGGTQAISRFSHGPSPVFLFTDFAIGWRGALWPQADGIFAIVARGAAPTSDSARLFLRNGERRTSILRIEGHAERRATRVGVRELPVAFRNDRLRLAGSLFIPPGLRPHPAVVFVHGSGPATRDNYREWSYFFAANGIAALTYDKRGAGESEGNWRDSRFDDLAGDVVAAVRFLRSRDDVYAERIGVSGGSQGAWVAPLAAAREPTISWLVLTGGGAITPARQERYRRLRLVEDAGYDGEALESASRVLDLYFEYLRTEDDGVARSLSIAHRRFAEAPWFHSLGIPDADPTKKPKEQWPRWMKRFQRELFFDPAPSLEASDVPVLVVMGAEDQGFPTTETIREYRHIVPSSRLTVEIIAEVDHGFFVSGSTSRPRYQAPEAFQTILKWIRQQSASSK